MTRDETRAFIERFVALTERGDAGPLGACYTEHARANSPMFHDLDGREAIVKAWTDFFGAIGQSTTRIDDIIIDSDAGDRAVVVFTSHATHTGMLFGVPATGRRMEVRGAFVMKFENGL